MLQREAEQGYAALDIPTHVALAYVQQHAGTVPPTTLSLPEAGAQAARLLLVVDAACDMPTAWLHNHKILVIPLVVELDGEQRLDVGDDVQSAAFVRLLRETGDAIASSSALSPTEIRDHMQPWMAASVEQLLQISFAASRSQSHMNALRATQSLVLIHNKVRRSIGNRTPLKAWVLDSRTGLTGTAVLLAHAAQLRNRGVDAQEIVPALDRLRDQVHTLLVPGDLRYLYQTIRRRGASTLTRLKFSLGKLLDIFPVLHAGAGDIRSVTNVRRQARAFDRALSIAARHVALGLSTPIVCVSFGGELDELHASASFEALRAECRHRRTELITSVMSMTGSAKLGPGALAISFASTHFTP